MPFKLKSFVLLIALSVFVPMIYHLALLSSFHSDDYILIYSVVSEGPFGIWSRRGSGFLRPVISVSLFVDYLIWHQEPFGFHLTNVVFHTANSWLVYLLTFRLLSFLDNLQREFDSTRVFMVSTAAGVLFASMPIHHEAVTWIAGRTDVIATFFVLLSLYAFVRYRLDGARRWWLVGSLLSASLAFFSKETALALPIFILVIEAFLGLPAKSRHWRFGLTNVVLFGVLGTAYLLFRIQWIGPFGNAYGFITLDKLLHLPTYAGLGVLDVVFHTGLLSVMGVVTGALIVIGIFVYALTQNRQSYFPIVVLGLAGLYVASLLPAAGVLPNTANLTPQGDRTFYLPSVFVAMLISALLLMPTWRWMLAGGIALILWNSAALQWVNTAWLQSGQQAETLLEDFSTYIHDDSDGYIVLNLPDSFRWAYMFRNGFEGAVALLGRVQEEDRLHVMTVHIQEQLSPHLQVYFDGEYVTVTPTSPLTRFNQSAFKPSNYRDAIERVECCSRVVLRLLPASENMTILYYSNGRLYRLER